mmetsp:Transcript_30289/g.47429  ORF Transcript_30289/g.47429 Transcript_30289/m.47429 type:complete len:80 (+) Transcript_30289:589-828(+)
MSRIAVDYCGEEYRHRRRHHRFDRNVEDVIFLLLLPHMSSPSSQPSGACPDTAKDDRLGPYFIVLNIHCLLVQIQPEVE